MQEDYYELNLRSPAPLTWIPLLKIRDFLEFLLDHYVA